MTSKLKINEIFTPRRADVNAKTYIARTNLEKELKRSLEGSVHTLIFGNSGTGKSWLYKKVLADNGVIFFVANCANAARYKSLTKEILSAVIPKGTKELEGLEEEISAEASAFFAKGGGKSSRKYSILLEDPILTAFHYMRKQSGSNLVVLVLDNLETIIGIEELMDELANIIILCDDNRYSKYNIKLLIVGVPSGVLEYFTKIKNLPTVSNRVQEISEVSNFSDSQVAAFIEVSFVNLLGLEIPITILTDWKNHIYKVTLGNPQRLHEYCQCVAHQLEDYRWLPNNNILENADINWLQQGLRESYATIDSLMNERDTEIGRRNQVLYALGQIQIHYFTPKIITDVVKKEFPNSSSGIKLGVSKILSDLCLKKNSIIKKYANGNKYEFTDPRYLMTLRTMLSKSPRGEKVTKLGFRV